jgi:hypothetical protein
MLEVSARFHNHSTNNQLLISLQCCDATRVLLFPAHYHGRHSPPTKESLPPRPSIYS